MLSGGIAVGKSSAASLAANETSATVLSARETLRARLALREDQRKLMQDRGADLDAATGGAWLVEPVLDLRVPVVIVDAVRTLQQVLAFRASFEDVWLVYFTASLETRASRYEGAASDDEMKRGTAFAEAIEHPTERGVSALEALADLTVDTDHASADWVGRRLARFILTRE